MLPAPIVYAINHLSARRAAWIESRVHGAIIRNVPGQLRRLHIPAAQFALAVNDRPLVSLAFGASSPSTPSRVASLAKPFAAFTCLRLAARGLFDLDAPLAPLLLDIPLDLSGVTPRLALSHTAGLADRVSPQFSNGTHGTLLDAVLGRHGERHRAHTEAKPGRVTRYSSAGYMLLQIALERRFGLPFDALARRETIEPLALLHTGYEAHGASLAPEHDAHGAVIDAPWTPSLAASGLWSTAADVARFGRSVLLSAREPGGPLPRDLARQMLTPHAADTPGDVFALGFHVQTTVRTRCLSHGCVRPGVRGLVLLFPRANIVFAAVVNGAEGTTIIRPLRGLVTSLAERRAGRFP